VKPDSRQKNQRANTNSAQRLANMEELPLGAYPSGV
jgi:hypothetical protein